MMQLQVLPFLGIQTLIAVAFVVVDADPRSAALRMVSGSLLPLVFGGVFAVVGLLLLFRGAFVP